MSCQRQAVAPAATEELPGASGGEELLSSVALPGACTPTAIPQGRAVEKRDRAQGRYVFAGRHMSAQNKTTRIRPVRRPRETSVGAAAKGIPGILLSGEEEFNLFPKKRLRNVACNQQQQLPTVRTSSTCFFSFSAQHGRDAFIYAHEDP